MGGGGTCTQKNSLIWQARQRLESCTGRTPGESVAQLFYLAVWRLSSGVIALLTQSVAGLLAAPAY
ncbi:hypothetical protein ACFPRL_16335 [Pseudoclavibacter helvolus]